MTNDCHETDLCGEWKFTFLGDVDPDAVDVREVAFDDHATVPGCFDVLPRYVGKRGLAAYGRTIHLTGEKRHRLTFDAVQHFARVYVAGVLVGEQTCGYTRFTCDIVDTPAGEVDLVVLVDNRFDAERSPLHLTTYDWYHYGGLTRRVTLRALPATWIESIRTETLSLDPPTLRVDVETAGDEALLRINVNGTTRVEQRVAAGRYQFDIAMDGAALWSPDAPNLHDLRIEAGNDTAARRVGLRKVCVRGRSILINGEPVRLRGVCLHESHVTFGCAIPDHVRRADVDRIIDLGCNFIRGTHYPMDEQLLDLCDERGLCVWCEGIGWNNAASQLGEPRFVDAQKKHLSQMIETACNHPSVILWGLLNEAASDAADARPSYETLIAHMRSLDDTRPITYASNRIHNGDRCLDLADIAAVNTYPGWYDGDLDDIPAQLDAVIERLNADGCADKPLIISELGAGAIPGWRDPHDGRWTETYQAKLLNIAIRHLFETRDDVAGLSIWQYGDVRTTEDVATTMKRPRGFNNKGIVDECRRPKEAYDTVRNLYRRLR